MVQLCSLQVSGSLNSAQKGWQRRQPGGTLCEESPPNSPHFSARPNAGFGGLGKAYRPEHGSQYVPTSVLPPRSLLTRRVSRSPRPAPTAEGDVREQPAQPMPVPHLSGRTGTWSSLTWLLELMRCRCESVWLKSDKTPVFCGTIRAASCGTRPPRVCFRLP